MKIERSTLITGGGTLLCALGIGYFMQAGQSASVPASAMPEAAIIETAGLRAPSPEVDRPELPHLTVSNVRLTAASPARPSVPDISAQSGAPGAIDLPPSAPEASAPPQAESPQPSCTPELTATPDAAAMVRLTLSAPCMPDARFTLHHNGLMLSEVTDSTGESRLMVPALSESAVFIAAFPGGDGAMAMADVSALSQYDRAAVQWQGDTGIQVHAREFGAAYDTDGHVWSGHARDFGAALGGTGGFVTRHGESSLDEALVAEVYTFPTGTIDRSGSVVLSVEAQVTRGNCGRDVEAQAIQKIGQDRLEAQSLVLAVPDCSAVGDFLVLKNLLNDLKVAAK